MNLRVNVEKSPDGMFSKAFLISRLWEMECELLPGFLAGWASEVPTLDFLWCSDRCSSHENYDDAKRALTANKVLKESARDKRRGLP